MATETQIQVEYELDQWEWQGTTHSIDIDPEDYRGMSAGEIKEALYQEIWRDAEQNLHFVYPENDVAQQILDALQKNGDDEDGD